LQGEQSATFRREKKNECEMKREGSLFILLGEGKIKEIIIKIIYLINININ
jgi:hypothetical protein